MDENVNVQDLLPPHEENRQTPEWKRGYAIAILMNGHTRAEAAEAAGVSMSTMSNWRRNLQERGNLKRKVGTGLVKKINTSTGSRLY
jgi:transposase